MDPRIARILDANANRAREGLRVMEDHARFILNHTHLSGSLKHLRHALAGLCARLPADSLVAARDTPGDVGTNITTAAEAARGSPADVARAAAARTQEALRSLEEYCKCMDAGLAREFEQLRYRAYELERRLLLGDERRQRLAAARLHVLITESLCRRAWLETAAAALDGGAEVLQLREKSLTDAELLKRAGQLRELTAERQALLIINDRPDVALLADADGVHVGQDDLPPAAARRIVGPDRIIGVSTHGPAQLRAALQLQPDYVAVGPMFQSTTKPQDHVAGPELLAEAVRLTTGEPGMIAEFPPTPIVAIGGITAGRFSALAAAGCRCVAVCSAVIGADDPAKAVRALRQEMPS